MPLVQLFKDIYSSFNSAQKIKYFKLQILIIFSAFFEIIGVISVVPFMQSVGDIDYLRGWLGSSIVADEILMLTDKALIVYLGLSSLLVMASSAACSIYITYRVAIFSASIGVEFADRLFENYMGSDWPFHASNNSADLTKQISVESQRFADLVMLPIMQMNAKIVLVIFFLLAFFIQDPYAAVGASVIFFTIYLMLFVVVRSRLISNGRVISEAYTSRFRILSEGLNGIRDLIILRRRSGYPKRFTEIGVGLARSKGLNVAYAQGPRYLIELIAFGSMTGGVLYLYIVNGGNLGGLLATLTAYALGGLKVLPSLQMIYVAVAHVKGNSESFYRIHDELTLDQKIVFPRSVDVGDTDSSMIKKNVAVSLNNVKFRYDDGYSAVENVSLNIEHGDVIGFIGSSGSGKSTLMDLICGLRQPTAGILNTYNKDGQKNPTFSVVHQDIFLTDGSIRDNITLGIDRAQVDDEKVWRSIDQAQLTEVVSSLDGRLDAELGERGVKLSGGQRQRIAIARALYNSPDIIIFDEATSALDGVSEGLVMDSLNRLVGDVTILIVAHRLETIRKCSKIIFMEKGNIIDSGSYAEVKIRQPAFFLLPNSNHKDSQ